MLYLTFKATEHIEATTHLKLSSHNRSESAGKPGSVVDDHSSRRTVADALKQPTRVPRGPRVWTPIWSCFEWGLPYRSVTRLVVRSYRTVSPLPRTSEDAVRRSTLCCTFRRLAPPRRYLALCPMKPGLSSPLHAGQRSSGQLRRAAYGGRSTNSRRISQHLL